MNRLRAFLAAVGQLYGRIETVVAKWGVLRKNTCSQCGGAAGEILTDVRGDAEGWKWKHRKACCGCDVLPCAAVGCENRSHYFLASTFRVGTRHATAEIPEDVPVCQECFEKLIRFNRLKIRAEWLLFLGTFPLFCTVVLPISRGAFLEGGPSMGPFYVAILATEALLFVPLTVVSFIIGVIAGRSAPSRRRKSSYVVSVPGSFGSTWKNDRIPHMKGIFLLFARSNPPE